MTTYSTPEVAAMTGVPYRMLDHWVRNGAVLPAEQGNGRDWRNRRWNDDDVAVVRVLAALGASGFAMQCSAMAPIVEAARSALIVGARWFAWSGDRWEVFTDELAMAAWVAAQTLPVWLIDLDTVCAVEREAVAC